ncbi:MAG: hypothetical protein WAL80_10120 [Xanthobacteraceae bacterium]|jgi:hypothetical protein
MNCHLYLRTGVLYLPTMGKMAEGFYRGVEPVAVVSASGIDAVRQALEATISRGNPIVPMLRRSEWKPPVLLKYAGVRSWSAFERGMLFWTIKDNNASFRIAGQRKTSNGMWNDDPEQMVIFPPEATTDDMIERMVAILQKAARK